MSVVKEKTKLGGVTIELNAVEAHALASLLGKFRAAPHTALADLKANLRGLTDTALGDDIPLCTDDGYEVPMFHFGNPIAGEMRVIPPGLVGADLIFGLSYDEAAQVLPLLRRATHGAAADLAELFKKSPEVVRRAGAYSFVDVPWPRCALGPYQPGQPVSRMALTSRVGNRAFVPAKNGFIMDWPEKHHGPVDLSTERVKAWQITPDEVTRAIMAALYGATQGNYEHVQ